MKVPKNWGQVTLKQHIEICEVQAVDMDELDKHVKILSILSGKSEDYILDLSLTSVKGYIRDIQFIYTKPEQGKIRQKIRIKGSRYFINLDVRKISSGEYIDITSLSKDKDSTIQNLHLILAIFFKPINILGYQKKKCFRKTEEGYVQTLESRDYTSKLLKEHLTMDIVFNMSGFFLKNWQNLTEAIQGCLIQTMEKQKKKIQKELKKAGLENIGRGI